MTLVTAQVVTITMNRGTDMQGQTQEINRHREEVRLLADKVHRIKVRMDQAVWGPGGLPTNDSELLGRCMKNLRSAGGNLSFAPHLQAHHLTLEYRKVRAQYMLAKAELDAISSFAAVPDRVKVARENMKKKFAGPIQQMVVTTGELNLTNDSSLTKAISDTLAESVRQMKKERSVAGIAVMFESLAAAESMGFDGVRKAECKSALNAAKVLAEQLINEAERRPKPHSPVLERNIIQLHSLSQSF